MSRLNREEIQALTERIREKTKSARVAVKQKRSKRSDTKAVQPPESIQVDDDVQTAKSVVNSNHVYGWYKTVLLEKYGSDFIVAPWTVVQKKLAKDLLGVYGGDLVKKAVGFFVESWDAIVSGSNDRLSGFPTINLMFGMRERIFADVQQGKKPLKYKDMSRISEYKGPADQDTGIGW